MHDTKEKILEIASDLIRSKGINGMSYQDISDAIGIRKASIHYHFPKKDDLIDALINDSKNKYHSFYLSIANSKESPLIKLKTIANIFAQGIEQNKVCLFAVLSSECELMNEQAVNYINDAISKTITIFSSIFKNAQDENLITTKIDSLELAHTYYNILNGGQIIGRSLGTTEFLHKSVEVFLKLL